jgi:hypothetical protein
MPWSVLILLYVFCDSFDKSKINESKAERHPVGGRMRPELGRSNQAELTHLMVASGCVTATAHHRLRRTDTLTVESMGNDSPARSLQTIRF